MSKLELPKEALEFLAGYNSTIKHLFMTYVTCYRLHVACCIFHVTFVELVLVTLMPWSIRLVGTYHT